MVSGEEWFWGGKFSADQKADLIQTFDRTIRHPGALAVMKYDHSAGVATLHIILEPTLRGGRNVGALIGQAVEQARSDGMQKVVAPLVGGSPHLKPNRDRKFGFTREATLRRHVFVSGALRDLHLYALFL